MAAGPRSETAHLAVLGLVEPLDGVRQVDGAGFDLDRHPGRSELDDQIELTAIDDQIASTNRCSQHEGGVVDDILAEPADFAVQI